MASYSGGIPIIGGAQWGGNPPLATKAQLVSSIAGLYADIQDIELSSITIADLKVSTLTAAKWISTPELYVSSIIGGGLKVNDALLQISTGDFSFVSLSTLQLKGVDIGGLNLSFNLGLGEAVGGALAGLGAALGGAFVGVGTGVGLTLQGLETGLATLINGRNENFINNSYFETINGSTQLQISTLGGPDPYYSSIFRSVSSSSANTVPGPQIFTSTIFQAGTTCIRSVSDPLSIITGDSNLVTSTIQSFGQWVPFLDPSVTGEDIFARNATFSTILTEVPSGGIALNVQASNAAPNDSAIYKNVTMFPLTYNYNTTSNYNTIANSASVYATDTALFYGNQTMNFISSPYSQYTSTIGNYSGGVYFIQSTITSSLTTIPKFIYNGSIFGGGNFAVCEPDETGFISSYTMDLVAQSSNITFQWGLAVDNLNSTIASGTSKRVSWNIPANTSNFIDIPVPISTIVANTLTTYQMKMKPLEITYLTVASPDNGSGGNKAGMAFDINRATFGGTTTFNNDTGYPYQFNNDVRVKGVLEADELIALSTFTSTNIVTYFSTQTFDADVATIEQATISSLQTTFIGGDSISSFGIETYSALHQIAYISTLVVDLQILEGTTGGTTANLNNIQGTIPSSRINMGRGTFNTLSSGNLSTGAVNVSSINFSSSQLLGLTNIYNYPGALTAMTSGNTTAPFVAIGFKAQINLNDDTQPRTDYNYNGVTATSNGANYFPLATFDSAQINPNVWSLTNINTATISTLNVNNISTNSHSGANITAITVTTSTLTVNSNIVFPSVSCNANPFVMTLSNTNTSNFFTALQTNVIQGAAFPQQSNTFQIITSGSNTTIQDREGLVFDVTVGTTVSFQDNIDTVTLNSADLEARSVKYGTLGAGFLQPRAFRQSITGNFGTTQSFDQSVQVTDVGSNTFPYSSYNLMTCLASFYVDNSIIAYNEVVLAPFDSNGYWWVQITGRVNAVSSEDYTISWNNLLFPYNMMT